MPVVLVMVLSHYLVLVCNISSKYFINFRCTLVINDYFNTNGNYLVYIFDGNT